MIKRLSIENLQIYFDEQGAPRFSDVKHRRDRAVVETQLAEYPDFIEQWIDASEQTRPRHIGEDEREFRARLRQLGRGLVKTHLFKREFIQTTIREVAKGIAQPPPHLSPDQVSECVEDAISTL
jgi:hypothetical protein